MEDLDRILHEYTDPTTGSLHGAAFIAVDRSGKIIYQKAAGRQRPAPGDEQPLQMDSLYWIASMTKLVTAVATVQLVERGLVSLDEDVHDRVPELKGIEILTDMKPEPDGLLKPVFVPVRGKLTLRHMLSHSGGLIYDSMSPLLQQWSQSRGRTAHTFSGSMDGYRHPMLFQPGTSWAYGAGLDWAGQLIENVTGSTLEEYMQANIWSKLGAASTTFHPELYADRLLPRMEMGERVSDGQGNRSIKPGKIMLGYPLQNDLGGIGLFSTPMDFTRLLSALLQGGGPVLNRESVDLLLKPQLSDMARVAMSKSLGKQMKRVLGVDSMDDCEQADHCLAGTVTLRDIPGRRRKGTASWGGLPNLHWWIDRESGIAATLFTQIVPPADAAVTELLLELEEALYRIIDGARQRNTSTKL
ncbi:beta-lactamase/transpeptidase-like protein [Aspergillus heterothallicus]